MREKIAIATVETNKENARGVEAMDFVVAKVGVTQVMDVMGLLVVRQSMNVF